MSRRRPPVSWSVVRTRSDESSLDDAPGCANCGRPTTDIVTGESLSVPARDGGRRLAPPMPLCEACRRDVIYRRGWTPTWCTACQGWRPFGHDHLASVRALPVPGTEPDHFVDAV